MLSTASEYLVTKSLCLLTEELAQWSVVDTCADNTISRLLLQIITTYGRDSMSQQRPWKQQFIKFIYGRRT